MSNKRISYYDNLKFILIFFVVLGHFLLIQLNFKLSLSIFLFIYSFHMPLFVFITGFLGKKIEDENGKFRINKVFSLLIIYFIFKLLCCFICLIFKVPFEQSFFVEQECPWYLLAFALWMIITYILKNIKPKYLLIFSILFALLVGYDTKVGDFLCTSRIIVFYPYFLLGYYLSKDNMKKVIDFMKARKMKIISFIVLITMIIVFYIFANNLSFLKTIFTGRNCYAYLETPFDIPFKGAVMRAFSFVLAIITSLCLMALIPTRKRFYTVFGSRTMQVYVLHYLIFLIMNHLGLLVKINDVFGNYSFLVAFALAILTTFVFSLKCFSIPFNKIMNLKFNKIFIDSGDNNG